MQFVFSIINTAMQKWIFLIKEYSNYILKHIRNGRSEDVLPEIDKRITFSKNNNEINSFFVSQNVKLPAVLFEQLLGFLSKACTYEEEEHRVRPSVIVGNNLLGTQIKSLTQATTIRLAKDLAAETHLTKRLKSMLPFCNNGWRVFMSLDDEYLTYGIMRNFNGPSGLSIDDILASISPNDKEKPGFNFVLIDIASNFEIILKGIYGSCTIDFRLINDGEANTKAQSDFPMDLLSACEGDIRKGISAYRKILGLFPQKLHGSICLIVKHDYILPDDILKDGIFLDTPIDIYQILDEELNDRQAVQDISSTISAHEKYHAFTGLLMEMLNIDGITIVDNKGRIRAYNVFVSPSTSGTEHLSGGARKRAANYLLQQKI